MMERRVKERLIGASILVVLIVLVVPELLSGPKSPAPPPRALQLPASAPSDEPIRNVTVDLTTSKAPAAADPETAPEPATAMAAPAAAASIASVPAPVPPAPSAMPAAAVPRPAAVESAAPPPISKSGAAHGEVSRTAAWAVQLGSFASRANADNLVHQVKAQGFAVYILSGGSGTATRHRVRVGPLADRDAAERTVARLKALGHASSLVSPGA
jgi:DedD protein